ncbi:MAG: hypothetical protein K9K78_08775 [Spirochaetales bacterium]|nr:hypothetical protein [Spirochaetales bacterium]
MAPANYHISREINCRTALELIPLLLILRIVVLIVFVLIVGVLIIGIAGCSLNPEINHLRIVLPETSALEEAQGKAPWYELTWPEEGEIRRVHVSASMGSIIVPYAKGAEVPFAAYPNGTGPPAGVWFSRKDFLHSGPLNPQNPLSPLSFSPAEYRLQLEWGKGDFAESMVNYYSLYPKRGAVLCLSWWYEKIEEIISLDEPQHIDCRRFDGQELLVGLTAGILDESIIRAADYCEIRLNEVAEKIKSAPRSPYGISSENSDGENYEGAGRWIMERDPSVILDKKSFLVDTILLSCPGSYQFYELGGNRSFTILINSSGGWQLIWE